MDFLLYFLCLNFVLGLNSGLRRHAFLATAHVDFRRVDWVWEFAKFEFRIKIKDEGLDVVGALFQVPKNLITARLVVQYLNNPLAFNILATGSRILKYLLSLIEVEQSLLNFIGLNEFFGFVIKAKDLVTELIYSYSKGTGVGQLNKLLLGHFERKLELFEVLLVGWLVDDWLLWLGMELGVRFGTCFDQDCSWVAAEGWWAH